MIYSHPAALSVLDWPGWIAALAGHFADPLVAAVAPRVVDAGPGPGGTN